MISLALAGCGNSDLVEGSVGTVDPPGTAANRAPSINGTPPSTVKVNQPYDFRPSAFDPDGDSLRFRISGKPAWAVFDAATGRLYGTPPAGTSGTFGGVQISVTDGAIEATLPAFSILVVASAPATSGAAVLNWSRPTQNTDGTTLGNLAGYRIYFGTDPSQLTTVREITDPAATGTSIGALTSGTWYFSVASFNSAGVESKKAGPVSLTIG